MIPSLAPTLVLSTLVFALATACAAPQTQADKKYSASIAAGTRAPVDGLEEAILNQLPTMQPGHSTTIDGHSVTVGPSYDAASGRRCRSVQVVAADAPPRLVCEMEAGWTFVPMVIESELSQR